jgi:hypothetical protein
MISDAVEPRLGLESFSCPHCNAVAHQEWFSLLLKSVTKSEGFVALTPDALTSSSSLYDNVKDKILFEQFVERLGKNAVTYRTLQHQQTSRTEMVNLHLSQCYSCRGFAVWVEDRLVYPITESAAHEELPASLRDDFEEAAAIIERSPRAAAALMRLCIHKMMLLGNENDRKLEDRVASLASKGLEVEIQEAMGALRALNDDAVYPSKSDEDDKLLELLTSIVKRRG